MAGKQPKIPPVSRTNAKGYWPEKSANAEFFVKRLHTPCFSFPSCFGTLLQWYDMSQTWTLFEPENVIIVSIKHPLMNIQDSRALHPSGISNSTSTSSPGATLAHLHISVHPLGPQYGMATSSYKGLAPDTVVAVVVKAADSRPFQKPDIILLLFWIGKSWVYTLDFSIPCFSVFVVLPLWNSCLDPTKCWMRNQLAALKLKDL